MLRICLQDMEVFGLLLVTLAINVRCSSESPPRITKCRDIHKAKVPESLNSSWTEEYAFLPGTSCQSVTLPVAQGEVINVTDPRNCENFYKCEGLTCTQCPCPLGQTFNPILLRCDTTPSVCQCGEQTTAVVIPPPTEKQHTPESSAVVTSQLEDHTNSSSYKDTSEGNLQPSPTPTEILIIAGIISATVILVVLIVVTFFLWQRRHFRTSQKGENPPQSNGGYLQTIPPTERHVYAEIDERMIAEGRHIDLTAAVHHPACPHQHTVQYHLNQVRSLPQSSVLFPVGPLDGSSTIAHHRESSSCSTYSNSSSPASLDSSDVDRRTLLHLIAPQRNVINTQRGNTHSNYVSRQVYI